MVHYGSEQPDFETSKFLISNKLESEWVWRSASSSEQAVQSKQKNKQYERKNEWISKKLNTRGLNSGWSEPQCGGTRDPI